MQNTLPFDLSPTGSRSRSSLIVSLLITLIFGSLSLAHFLGWIELPSDLSSLPLGLISAAFALIGLIFGIRSLSRSSFYRVYPAKRKIQLIHRSLLGNRTGHTIRFAELDFVRVAREVHGSSKDKTTYYPVYIHPKNTDPERVSIAYEYEPSRRRSERLARVAGVDLQDDSYPDETRVRKPEELDETVTQKLSKEFYHRPAPSAPDRMHSRIELGLEGLRIGIPRLDLSLLGPIQMVVWILLAVLIVGAAVAYLLEGYPFFLFAVLVLIVMVYVLFRSETILLSREALSVRKGIFFLKRKWSIPLSELEELYVTNLTEDEDKEADQLLERGEVTKDVHTALETIVALGSALMARSDRPSISFGRLLPTEELEYILYELESRLRG